MEDFELNLRSSAIQFEEFLNSTIWTDMKSELEIWIKSVREELEDPKTSDRDRLIGVGRADALKYFKELPEVIKDQLVELQQKETKDNKEGENLDG